MEINMGLFGKLLKKHSTKGNQKAQNSSNNFYIKSYPMPTIPEQNINTAGGLERYLNLGSERILSIIMREIRVPDNCKNISMKTFYDASKRAWYTSKIKFPNFIVETHKTYFNESQLQKLLSEKGILTKTNGEFSIYAKDLPSEERESSTGDMFVRVKTYFFDVTKEKDFLLNK